MLLYKEIWLRNSSDRRCSYCQLPNKLTTTIYFELYSLNNLSKCSLKFFLLFTWEELTTILLLREAYYQKIGTDPLTWTKVLILSSTLIIYSDSQKLAQNPPHWIPLELNLVPPCIKLLLVIKRKSNLACFMEETKPWMI